ncbi:hypothetical protein FOB42_03290 [Bordetella bronchiseptica]|nr:hypothetical protein FOB42_03290 [Bordetella bronchiseptica]
MTPYRNLSGQSNVNSYEITEDSIHVVFKSGAQRNYLYTNDRPGKAIVDQMKTLAEQGRGLNSYIARVVKSNFARKW